MGTFFHQSHWELRVFLPMRLGKESSLKQLANVPPTRQKGSQPPPSVSKQITPGVTPWKLTYPLKIADWKMKISFEQWSRISGNEFVHFQGGTQSSLQPNLCGWTNPVEQCARQIRSFPQFPGWTEQIVWNHLLHHGLEWFHGIWEGLVLKIPCIYSLLPHPLHIKPLLKIIKSYCHTQNPKGPVQRQHQSSPQNAGGQREPNGLCVYFFYGELEILTPMFGLTLGSQWGKSSLFK